jgi:hypothetical protein
MMLKFPPPRLGANDQWTFNTHQGTEGNKNIVGISEMSMRSSTR